MSVDLEKLNENGTDTFSDLVSKFNSNMDKIKNNILTMYPVGSIYLSTNNVNPNTLWGGGYGNNLVKEKC